ncbi:MAG: FkbM family methyltransferase [Gammaproteobacteria bacterium]|nr:FkbM family methyltransferase [Gammaproteobacteria bacterium]
MAVLTQDQFDALTALKCSVAYNRYGAYCVPASSRHRPAAQTILAGDIYEPGTIEFMRGNCGTGDIVHAGTYFGDFLPALSQGIAPGARIWAFEPGSENFRCAAVTLLLNDIDNVELFHAGVGSRRETLPLLTADQDGVARGGSSRILVDAVPASAHTELSAMVTIDETIPPDRHVSIIQLDVEGHERRALAGALRTVARCRPIVVIEVLADSNLVQSEWFAENFLRAGYRYTGSIHGNAVFFPPGPRQI